jgi:hypothetical protein
MGQLPPVFKGDRKLAKSFIDCLNTYFRLNHQVPAFRSYYTRIALALTLVQGPLVQEWTRNMGEWLDVQPDVDDDIHAWQQFVTQFHATFLDSQKDQRARNDRENLRMKWPLINEYTMEFARLTREAGYQPRSAESIQVYLKGLPTSVAKDVLQPPLVHTFPQILQRAIESVKSQELLASLSKLRDAPSRPTSKQAPWQAFGGNQNSRRPPPSYPPPGWQNPNIGRYNSSNAPKNYNNVPVAMDLGHARDNRGQGRCPYQVNATTTPFMGDCFNCGRQRHMKRDCKQPLKGKTRARTAAIQESWRTDDGVEETLIDWTPEDNQTTRDDQTTRVDAAARAFMALSVDERGAMVSKLGGETTDFPNA